VAPEPEKELPTITFNLETDVGITFTTPWQADATMGGSQSWNFTIDGPEHVLDFIAKYAIGGATGGVLSPPMQVTISDTKVRKAAGIPLECASFCFCYPLECLAGKYEEIMAHEGACPAWAFFLLLGGYAYFDASQRLVRTNAFVLTPAKASFTHVGPFHPSASAMDELRRSDRLRAVTLRPLLESGFVRFGWANPGERPGGHPLLSDGTDPPGAGAFVYEMSDGMSVLYPLVTKKRETQLLQRKKAEEEVAAAKAKMSLSDSLAKQMSRGAAHDKLMSSFGKVAAAALGAVDAAKKLQKELDSWRRNRVETWLRTHGVLIISYYLIGTLAFGFFEGWGALDSVYYLTAVATTNGDEINPVTLPGKLFSTLYIILGITVVMGGIAPLALFFIEPIKEGLLDPMAMGFAIRFDRWMQTLKTSARAMQEEAHENDWPMLETLNGALRRVQEAVDQMVGEEPVGGGDVAAERDAEVHRHSSIQAVFKGYFTALMLFLGVLGVGLALSITVHGYSLIEALYWTVGCMTTAGGDLKADTNLLKILYIFYMPLAVVGAFTAANTLIKTSRLRRVRLENYEVRISEMLHNEARLLKSPYAEMREGDFILAVLKHQALVDQETITAIRDQFARLVAIDDRIRSGQGERVIDAQVLFQHLQRQQRVVSVKKQKAYERLGQAGIEVSGRRLTTHFVDTSADDGGYKEWWDAHWVPSVDGEGFEKRGSVAGGYSRIQDEPSVGAGLSA